MDINFPPENAGDTQWQRRYLDLSEFIQQTGRLPSAHHQEPAERRLHRWLQRQQKRVAAQTLPLVFVQQLEALVPDVSAVRRGPPHTWMIHYNSLATFLQVNGRMPTSMHPQNAGEDRLARWWHRQLTATGTQILSAEQQHLLDSLPVGQHPPDKAPPSPT